MSFSKKCIYDISSKSLFQSFTRASFKIQTSKTNLRIESNDNFKLNLKTCHFHSEYSQILHFKKKIIESFSSMNNFSFCHNTIKENKCFNNYSLFTTKFKTDKKNYNFRFSKRFIHSQQNQNSPSNGKSDESIYNKDHIELDQVSESEFKKYLKICSDHLSRVNREQYLMTKYLPNDNLRTLAILLYTLNSELSQVKSSASRNELGADIRLQWWHDAIKDTVNGVPPSVPVLIVLSAYIKKSQRNENQIPWWTLLRKILTSKKMDISWATQPPTLESIEKYGDASYGSILTILLASIGIRDQYSENVAAHVGCAFGLSLLLRGTIYHAANQTTYLPSDLCVKYGVSERDIYTGENKDEISKVIFDVAESSYAHLNQAREKQEKMHITSQVYKQIAPIFYPSILTNIILKRLEKNNFDIYSTPLSPDQILFEYSTKLIWKQYFTDRKI